MGDATKAVDGYIRKHKQWSAELTRLRAILLDAELVEEVKWMSPFYTLDGGGIVAFLNAFSTFCAINFAKGALMRDDAKLLEKIGENTQAGRRVRITDMADVERVASTLKAYVAEAIALERSGAKVAMKRTSDFAVPEEFRERLDASPALAEAFASLTPGRQRAYLLHFAGAKQSKTRAARVAKHEPRILEGKGIDD